MKYKVKVQYILSQDMIIDSEEQKELGTTCDNCKDAKEIVEDLVDDLGIELFENSERSYQVVDVSVV